jgi:hypothetical protein
MSGALGSSYFVQKQLMNSSMKDWPNNFCLFFIFLQILACIKLSFDVFCEVITFCFLGLFPFFAGEIFLLTFYS